MHPWLTRSSKSSPEIARVSRGFAGSLTCTIQSLKKRLHSIDIPTELIWGAHDGIVDTAYGKRYADAIAGAKLTVIENAGHFPHVEQPEEFMRVLRDALA